MPRINTDEEATVTCIVCGDLGTQAFPIQNDHYAMVGYVFACVSCIPSVDGVEVTLEED